MKNWGTKRNVFKISFAYIFYFLILLLISSQCSSDWCRIREDDAPVVVLYALLPFALVFFLSLLTYRMHDDVFRAWWNFARWMVPIIMFASIAIQFVPSNGGFFNMDGLIYLFVLAPLYAALIFGSLWKIVQKYHELKKVS